jgi:2-polyprenyl-3-methyl-5-hydroxy-6-metoxy-1,4-benzoquinol methylase
MRDKKMLSHDELASRNNWDHFANNYETARRLHLVFGTLINLPELPGSLFLDAGSGGGHFSQMAGEYGAQVISFDIGLNLLKQVRNRCSSQRVSGSVLQVPFKEGTFDVVLSTEVIEHTPSPVSAVREMCSVVKPGGLLIITVPCRLWNFVVRSASYLGLRPYRGYENFLWPGEIKRVIEEEGFQIEMLRGFNFCPIFTNKLDRLFVFFDNLYGLRWPYLMVNIAVRARKR